MMTAMNTKCQDRFAGWLARAAVVCGASFLLIATAGSVGSALARVGPSGPPPTYIYFFRGGYDFAKLDPGNQEILARWFLPETAGAKDWVPPLTKPWGPAERWLYDASLRRAYGLFPDRVYAPEAAEGQYPEIQYVVLAFELPLLRAVRRFGPFRAAGIPEIRISGDGTRLFVSYAPPRDQAVEPGVRMDTAAIYRWGVIELINTETGQRELRVPEASFSERALMLSGGTVIYDGELLDRWRLTFRNNGVVRERITGETFVNDKVGAVIEQQAGLRPGELARLQTFLGDPAGGRIPVVFGRNMWDQIGISIFDLESRRLVSPLIPVRAEASGRLSSDGKLYVFEGVEHRTRDARGTELPPGGLNARTGKFWVHEVETGKLVKEFSAPELAGMLNDVKVRCRGPHGEELFAAWPHLYWVDYGATPPVKEISASAPLHLFSACMVADQ
jgi:hypothetical protein